MLSAPSPGWPRQSWIAIEQATWVSSGLLLHGFSADTIPYQMLNTGYVRFSLSHIPATQRLRFVRSGVIRAYSPSLNVPIGAILSSGCAPEGAYWFCHGPGAGIYRSLRV